LLVSRSSMAQRAGNSGSVLPVLSADGSVLAFQSSAGDLVGDDFNGRSDVFVLSLGTRDSDGDAMDDAWELAYFGDLSRDGLGDFDQDGMSDRLEYLAGTDPTNLGSVFRVMALTPLSGGAVKLVWSSVP